MDGKDAGRTNTAAELESIRAAARWVVGGAAAVLAVVLAGAQVTAIARIDEFTAVRGGGAIAAATLALVAAGVVLWLAARVLIPPTWTLGDLAHRELTDEDWPTHWAHDELHGQRAVLSLTTELRLADLYRHQRALLLAAVELGERGRATVRGDLLGRADAETTYLASDPEDDARLRQRLRTADALAERITSAVAVADVRRRYRLLVKRIPLLGLVVVLGVAAFTWATAPPGGAPVTSPVEVRLRFTADQGAIRDGGIPAGCAGRTVRGVALGGTLEEPVVSSVEDPGCVLAQTRVSADTAVVIPSPPSK